MAEDESKIIQNLEARIKCVETRLSHPKKDAWDRINALSGIITGILVAGIGFYATNIYDKRSREAEQNDKDRSVVAIELQTVEKFFPHLASNNETEKQAAIQAISSLANPELAAQIAAAFGGAGARAALTNIANAGSPQTKSSVQIALTDLFRQFSGSVGRIHVTGLNSATGSNFASEGTCVVVSQGGYVLTVAHVITQFGESGNLTISVSLGSGSAPSQLADLINLDKNLDLALLKVRATSAIVPVTISTEQLQPGDAVSSLGFAMGQDLRVSSGIIASVNGHDGHLVMTLPLAPGDSGSPVFNSRGEAGRHRDFRSY
jgi:hypothetical protein